MLKIAKGMADRLSVDPRTKVGCVLVRDGVVISAGVNTLPAGVTPNPTLLANRQLKNLLMVHAEVNAILNSAVDVAGSTAYVTHHPCKRCAAALAAHGIVKVIVPDVPPSEGWELSQAEAARVLTARGVSLEKH